MVRGRARLIEGDFLFQNTFLLGRKRGLTNDLMLSNMTSQKMI